MLERAIGDMISFYSAQRTPLRPEPGGSTAGAVQAICRGVLAVRQIMPISNARA
jgi:hypothetical protein